MVRKELVSAGKIRSYTDLRGARIALVGGMGSTGAFALDRALSNGGLSMKDVTIVTMTYPDLVPAFSNGSVDAAIVVEPFQTFIETQGTGVIWKSYSELFGHPTQIAVILYSDSFAGKQDLARRFMIAYLRGARSYNDAFGKRHNYAEIVDILAKRTGQKAQIIQDMHLPGIDPDGRVRMESLQEHLDFFTRAGHVEKKVDLSGAVDRSFIDFAVGKLGPYSP
jgi:NitT/TauT family transport system substrate-binding protein